MDTVPASFRRRIKQFVDGYLGSERMPVAFGGRSTELNALNAWFEDPDAPSHLLVAAEAGRGKTALLVRWLEQLDDDIPLAFVPISIRYQTSRPAVFFQAFAARLAYLLGETLPTATSDPAEFYKEKLSEYLEILEDRGTPCLIVIDGLDEATGWQFDAGFLPECTGSCLRVLVSARILAGDQDETGWLRRLEWDDPDASVAAMRIPPLNPIGISDVLHQTHPQLAPFATDEDLVANLDRLTAGDPLLLTFYVADLRQWIADGETGRPNLSDSPAGFGPYFERWLKKQGGIYQDTGAAFDEQIIKAILAILACAIGPLPLRDLAALVEHLTEERHLIAKDTMIPLERFIVGDGNDLGYALGHPKLRNYIRDEYFGGSDNVDRAERVFVDWGREKIAALASDKMVPTDMPHYVLQFHAQHLQVVGAEIAAYRELLSPTWRTAWEADRQGEGYLGLSNDVEIATHAMIDAMATAPPKAQPDLWADIFGGALIASSIHSLSSGIPPALLAKALEHDALAVGSALHFAERREPTAQLKAIAAVAEALSDNRRRIVMEEAFASITTFATQIAQSDAIADLAPFLPPDLLSEALEFALVRGSQSAFLGLIPVLSPTDRSRAFDAAFDRLTPTQIFGMVAALEPRFYEDRQQQLLALAKKGSNLHDRALAFRDIANVLDAENQQTLAQEALRSVRVTDHTQIDWNDVQNALSPLRPEIRNPAISEIATLTAKRFAEDLERRIELNLDPEFSFDQGLSEDEIRNQSHHEVRSHFAHAVLKLAHMADPQSIGDIFDLAHSVLGPTLALQCYSILAKRASEADQQTYVDAALAVLDQDDWTQRISSHLAPKRETIERVDALVTLAHLSDCDLKTRLSDEATNLAARLPVLESAQCLSLLPKQDRPAIIHHTLNRLSRQGYVADRQDTLETLAPHLDESTVKEALQVATRVSTGDDLALLIQTLSGHLSKEATHRAFTETLSFMHNSCLSCLKDLGPHLNEDDARAALDRLAMNDMKNHAGMVEAEVIKSLPANDRQAFMHAKVTAWTVHLLEKIGSFDPAPIKAYAPHMTTDQRHKILNLLFDNPPPRSEFLVADLLDAAYVDRHPDARDRIKTYLNQSDTLNALSLCHTLRTIFGDTIQSVLPDSWIGLRGLYDLPRHYALGDDQSNPELMQESERFAQKIRRAVLSEYDDTWSEWQEWKDTMKNLPADAATRHADFLCSYLREPIQPNDPELPEPGGAHALSLLSREVCNAALMCSPYLSPDQLHALLDHETDPFNAEIIIKSVFMTATGPVFDRVLPLMHPNTITGLSRSEMVTTLDSKTPDEALQVYALWRVKWPNAVQSTLDPFLQYLSPEGISDLAKDAQNLEPQAYFDSLPDLLQSAPASALPGLVDHALGLLPDKPDLEMLTPLVAKTDGDTLSQVLHLYARRLSTLPRTTIMEELSTVSGALHDSGQVGGADALFGRVSTVLKDWQ